jgi:hypothetical protein
MLRPSRKWRRIIWFIGTDVSIEPRMTLPTRFVARKSPLGPRAGLDAVKKTLSLLTPPVMEHPAYWLSIGLLSYPGSIVIIITLCCIFFFLWRYSPNLGLGLPPSNSPFHFGLLELKTLGRTPWAGDQLVARPLPVGFELMIPASERAKTVHALDRSATVTGMLYISSRNYVIPVFVGRKLDRTV